MAIKLSLPTASRTATGSLADLGDSHLLALFANSGISAEDAFTTLVERHGPMVLRVGRSLLRNEHEAQDLFQSTFLVLARKARRIWVGDSLGPWLHGVACRVASDARKASSRRQTLERKVRAMSPSEPGTLPESEDRREMAAALHEEIARLPESNRAAVVLCDLQGRTHAEAAAVLGWPVGTVKSRQARAREQLRGRLARRGLALSSGVIVALLAFEGESAFAAPPAVSRSTVRAALRFSAGGSPAVAGMVTAKVLGQASKASVGLTVAWLRPTAIALVLVAATSVVALRNAGPLLRPRALFSSPSQRNSTPRGSLAGLRWKAERIDAWDPEVTDEENAPFHALVKRAKARGLKFPGPPEVGEDQQRDDSASTDKNAKGDSVRPKSSR